MLFPSHFNRTVFEGEETSSSPSFRDDVNVVPPKVRMKRRTKMLQDELYRNIPEYYPWMYLDGFTPD